MSKERWSLIERSEILRYEICARKEICTLQRDATNMKSPSYNRHCTRMTNILYDNGSGISEANRMNRSCVLRGEHP